MLHLAVLPTVLGTSTSHDLFTVGIPLVEKVIRTVAVYAGLLLLLRLGGKRDLAQLNSFDLVVLLLLSNVVQNAIIGNDDSLLGGLIGAAVLVGANAVVVRAVRRDPRAIRVFEGSPTVLVEDGEMLHEPIRRLGLREPDVETALRRQDAGSVAEVARAVLMPGGAITVDLKAEDVNATKGDVDRLEAKLDALLARQG